MIRAAALGGLTLLVGLTASCGTRAPSTPEAWIDSCFETLDGRGATARFKMWLTVQSSEASMQLERRGEASLRSAALFRIQAESELALQLPGQDLQRGMTQDLQVGDGEVRWLELARPDGRPPRVQELPLDGARPSEQAGETESYPAPVDLDPIALLRLYTEHCSWTEEFASEPRYVVLLGTDTPALRQEVARLGSAFEPTRVRLTLDRDTALPIDLSILEQGYASEGSAPTPGELSTLKIRYMAWTIGTVDALQFSYAPPTPTPSEESDGS
ncbi:MAG: hypothetical protein CMJ94_15215 [Planctomycetes bacterium]|nr:hypothetical protein [Planctomycetota bacterium]